jgi:hypothetical protein
MVTLHEAYRDFENLPPLAPDEKASPYAKFYYVPVELPAPEILEAIDVDTQMDPAKALPITEMARLFAPGYHDVENGWCVMPDGTGYSAVKIELPDVTAGELMMFNAYGHLNNLQYKTWLPKLHLQQGAFTIENFGWGPLLFHQREMMKASGMEVDLSDPSKMDPETLSRMTFKMNGIDIDDPTALDPDYVALIGGSIYTIDVLTGERNDITMVTYIRTKGEGVELRVRVWDGLHIINGEPVRKIGEGESFPADKVCAIATHNAFEWTRANTIARDVCSMMTGGNAGMTAAGTPESAPANASASNSSEPDPGIEGAWKGTITAPMGEQATELDLKVDGTALFGTMVFMGKTIDLRDGVATKSGFSFSTQAKVMLRKVESHIEGTRDGDRLVGTMTNPMGTLPFEARRA